MKKISKAQEKEGETGFDYLMLVTCAKIQEGFLACTWGEDNAANLTLLNVFISGSGYVTSSEARVTSSMQCPLAMTSCSGPGKGQRAWIQAGVELQPLYLALYFHRLLAFSQPNIPSLPKSKTNPIAPVRINCDEWENISHVSGRY